MTSPNIDQAIISILISGEEISGPQIKEYVLKNVPGVNRKYYDQRCSYLMRQTDLGKLVKRRREGKGVAYRLVTAALDCKPEELMVFVKKYPKPREAVLSHHKALRPYFEPDESTPAEPSGQLKRPEIQPTSEAPSDLKAIIQTAISSALGVNVQIGGRIEIVFKIGD